jgi:transcriptional regulator with XRE-family HTH domain
MAHRFGIDRGHISEIENGKKNVCLPMLAVLAKGSKFKYQNCSRASDYERILSVFFLAHVSTAYFFDRRRSFRFSYLIGPQNKKQF